MKGCCHGDENAFESLADVGKIVEDIDFVLGQLQVQVTKAPNPLKRRGFVQFEAQLFNKLKAATKKVSGDEVASIRKLIRSVNFEKPETIENFVKKSADLLKGLERGIAREIVPVLENAIRDMYELSKGAMTGELLNTDRITGNKRKLSAFGTRDERVVDLINKHQVFYVREGVKNQIVNFDARAKKLLGDALAGGWSRERTTTALMKSFGSSVDDPSYWRTVASAWLNRTRNWASLEVMSLGGIEEYVIIEAMDSRTCPICENMNGKTFKVANQIKLLEDVAASEDPNDLRYNTPWLTTRRTEDDKIEVGYRRTLGGRFQSVGVVGSFKPEAALQRLGVAMPPFHGLCRGTVGAA